MYMLDKGEEFLAIAIPSFSHSLVRIDFSMSLDIVSCNSISSHLKLLLFLLFCYSMRYES